MLLAQGRYWHATRAKGADEVELALLRDSLPDEQRELRELKVTVPLDRWNRVVKQVMADRKLLGGVLLDFAAPQDQLSAALGNDRLFGELQRVVVEGTISLVESGALSLAVVDVGAELRSELRARRQG